MFEPLNLPKAELKITKKEEQYFVWDIFRKKSLKLTPEEWVRQHFFHYLMNQKGVPLPLISSEYSIKVNELSRRCDGVIFDRSGQALAIIECKAPSIKLNQETLYQIAQYNFKLRVKWLILTNGIQTITCLINHEESKLNYLEEVPNYEVLLKIKG